MEQIKGMSKVVKNNLTGFKLEVMKKRASRDDAGYTKI
jgi:hypothetical protein